MRRHETKPTSRARCHLDTGAECKALCEYNETPAPFKCALQDSQKTALVVRLKKAACEYFMQLKVSVHLPAFLLCSRLLVRDVMWISCTITQSGSVRFCQNNHNYALGFFFLIFPHALSEERFPPLTFLTYFFFYMDDCLQICSLSVASCRSHHYRVLQNHQLYLDLIQSNGEEGRKNSSSILSPPRRGFLIYDSLHSCVNIWWVKL